MNLSSRTLLSLAAFSTSFAIATNASPHTALGGEAISGTEWSYSPWYGYYHETDSSWIYHIDHGWQYLLDGGAGATWAWDEALGDWVWIQNGSYPWMFSQAIDGWGYFSAYAKRPSDPRWFFLADNGHWVNDRGQDLDELVAAAWEFAEAQVSKTLQRFSVNGGIYPYHTDRDGQWLRNRGQSHWTAGYWPAIMWYLYVHTGDEQWRTRAEAWSAPITKSTNTDIAVRYFYSYGRGWQLTGNESYWDKLVEATDFMMDEWFVESLQSFQSWERGWSQTNHAVVTDIALHMQPFFALARATGDMSYDVAARAELDTIIDLNIREDGSTLHFTDLNSDGSIRGINNTSAYQGYREEPIDSVWSRAQAWAVMAFPMGYRYTGEVRYLEAAQLLSDYFIQELPEDHVPPSSFRPVLHNDIKDASAAAIAAVGLRELAMQTGDPYYENAYRNILLALTTKYLAKGTSFQSIIHRASHRTGSAEIGTVYGDCFFLEALLAYESNIVYAVLPEDTE